jgi:preprotein translocase subunit SecD
MIQKNGSRFSDKIISNMKSDRMAGRFRALLLMSLMSVALVSSAAFAGPLILEVTEAKASVEIGSREPVLTITLSPAGREAFARFTTENVGRKTEIRIDGKVMMRPIIREPILGGVLQISGSSLNDLRALASRLSAGSVKIEVEVVPD